MRFQNQRARYQGQEKSGPDEELELSQDQDHPEEDTQSREDRHCCTSYNSTQLHLTEAFMNNLALIPESNLLRNLSFLNQEPKFVFKIRDPDSISREKENLIMKT